MKDTSKCKFVYKVVNANIGVNKIAIKIFYCKLPETVTNCPEWEQDN